MATELKSLLCDVAQIFDGWHCDIAWSEWDESVRRRVSEAQKELEAGAVKSQEIADDIVDVIYRNIESRTDDVWDHASIVKDILPVIEKAITKGTK